MLASFALNCVLALLITLRAVVSGSRDLVDTWAAVLNPTFGCTSIKAYQTGDPVSLATALQVVRRAIALTCWRPTS
ncbi:hypothetical protein HYQ46_011298 [Verticillium longisporum]|nr:hypothetical protein HYQ44_018451 [Verticillium longisporum]KAG7114613.1 hypothetical protein HYQ46_011298 [Verticillium longisporum]